MSESTPIYNIPNETAVTIAATRANVSSELAYRWIADSMRPNAPKPLPGTTEQRVLDCYYSAVARYEAGYSDCDGLDAHQAGTPPPKTKRKMQ